jgi:hypothetical protein
MHKRFVASYTKWGNLYRGRFYVDGKRVPEWRYDVLFNTYVSKSGASYTRKMENHSIGYRIIHTIA